MHPAVWPIALCVLAQPSARGPSVQAVVRSEQAFARGQLAFHRKAYSKSIEQFNRALKHRPGWVRARHWRGLALAVMGKHRAAEDDLTAAVNASPRDGTLRKALAMAQMSQKKFMWALRQLQAVAEISPADMEAKLSMAYCLMRLEEYDDARGLLKKILKQARSPKIKRKARLMLGLCLYRKDKLDRARMLISAVGSGPGGPGTWRKSARDLLELLLERQFGVRKGWGWSVSVGAGMDTNPAMNHEGQPGWSRTNDVALDTFLNGRIWWTPLTRGRHSLGGELSVQRHFYVAAWNDETQDRVSAFNMTIGEAGGVYRYGYLAKGLHRSVALAYSFQLIQLDGGPGLPSEPDPFLFSEKHQLRLTHGWRHNPKHATDLLLRPWYVAYRDKDRDGAGFKLSARHSVFLLGRRLKLFPELWMGYQHARWQAWRYAFAGCWMGLSYLAPWKLDVTGSASYEFRHHMRSSEALAWPNAWDLPAGDDRMDHAMSVAVGLGRALDKKKRWRVDLTLRYTYNASKAGLYRYSRLAVLLGVTAAMEKTSGGWR